MKDPLDFLGVAYVLDLGCMTPSLRRSKPPLVHRSAAPPIKTTTLSRMNTERSAFFLRIEQSVLENELVEAFSF
ncbi:hypothetical protein SO802_015696 [Lithocarpus litseifolius]|uniref:Uncharacterized protein n=1 Tax=Lithocarpus litseifolius TaxID=425828 RepID=A0AAW2CYI7_9ROSI